MNFQKLTIALSISIIMGLTLVLAASSNSPKNTPETNSYLKEYIESRNQ